jgi:hypothetical protein
MSQPIDYQKIADEIRDVYRTDPEGAAPRIEGLLEERFKDLPHPERLAAIGDLKSTFRSAGFPEQQTELEFLRIREIASLILGREMSQKESESGELLDRLLRSLDTVFDALNDLIRVIRLTLLGQDMQLETIRQVIGSQLEGQERSLSLESHLNQIKEAFLIAHRAFQEAAKGSMHRVLEELDPETLAAASKGGFKIGPMRRAELFDIYQERFQQIKEWFNSGRFSEEVLRAFEGICQRDYANGGGRDENRG